MRRVALVLPVVVSVASCGGRSELFFDDHDGGGRDASLCPVPPTGNACPSAVSGATPMRTYCSTRSWLAPHLAPEAPTKRWMVQLPSDRSPPEIVVDDCGRTYVTYDPNLGASQATPHVLVAFDERGEIAMERDFSPDALRNLFIARDGTLRGTLGFRPTRLVRVDRDGDVTVLGVLPEGSRRYAVASDETLLVTVADLRSPAYVVRTAIDGTVLWTSPPIGDDTCSGCLSEVALLPDDRAIFATYTIEGGTDVLCLDDTTGAIAWTRVVDGILVQGPAVALDSTIRLVTGTTDAAVPTTLVTSLSASGEVLWQIVLDEDYQQTWSSPLVVTADGATLVRSFGALTIIAQDGSIRRRTDGPQNLTYEAVVDARGTLVLMLGGIVASDIATGDELWQVEPPGWVDGTFHFMSHIALGAHGCVIGANYGGAVFAACDDERAPR